MTGFAFDLGEWFSDNAPQVRQNFSRYFAGGPGDQFTGRWFEKFAAMGDPNLFEPSDVVAVEALSVKVPPESAARLIIAETERFSSLLRSVPNEVDLWEVGLEVIDAGAAASEMHALLDDLQGVGWVTAGKLLAAKRPRLIPILDKEVEGLLKPPRGRFWAAMHEHLSDADRRKAISDVCSTAPDGVSLLRCIDVALWMYATQTRLQSPSV